MPITVALELEWVLRSAFEFDKATVLQTLPQLLGAVELRFESESALETALVSYAESAADFSDCLHAALAATSGEQSLWTFDKAASKVSGVRLLR